MDKVNDNEQERIRLGKEFRKRVPHVKGEGKDAMREAMKRDHEQKWKEKETHGYLGKQLEDNNYVDNTLTNNWFQQHLSSHIEGFVMAIQEQELDFKETRRRREKDPTKKRNMDIKCRVCRINEESVFHVICSCPVLAPMLYLSVRHNQLTRILYQEVLGNEKIIYKPPDITKKGNIGIWYDREIETITKVEKNKPDIQIWNNESNTCQLVEIIVPLDTNVKSSTNIKDIIYILLVSQLQRLYKNCRFSIVTVTVGGLGAIPRDLENKLKEISIEPERIKPIVIGRLQKAAVLGTMKVCKTVIKM